MSFNFHGSMSIREQKTGIGRAELELSDYNEEIGEISDRFFLFSETEAKFVYSSSCLVFWI